MHIQLGIRSNRLLSGVRELCANCARWLFIYRWSKNLHVGTVVRNSKSGYAPPRLCLNHTVQKHSRGVLGTSFRFGPTSEILENIQYGGSSVVENWQPKEPFYRQRSVILRYCWRSLRLLWLLKSSWSCIVSNRFINVLSIYLVPLTGITEENSTVQRDILNYSNICWHVHHL